MKSFIQYSSSPQRGHHTVPLVDTKISTSGVYRCQITEAQAPFHTEQQDKNLTIISKIFKNYSVEKNVLISINCIGIALTDVAAPYVY